MPADPRLEAATALFRFGFGPRADGLAAIGGDARAAVLADIDRADAGRLDASDLMSSGDAARAVFEDNQDRRERRAAATAPAAEAAAEPQTTAKPDAAQQPNAVRRIYLAEAQARFAAAQSSDIGFVERLVWFWSNHFCVSAAKGPFVRAQAGAFEREAIRPHVLGRFADMLLAVEQHPAMLRYLDNFGSIGPHSIAGERRGRGLNENLAREILELHTLGVRTGYSQDDVTSFAHVITGWTLQAPERGGEFVFNPRMHEPGAKTVLGTSYRQAGLDQGVAVLADLARRPETAQHLCSKLVRHFIADEPPAALVERLTRRFLDTDGDLKALARALATAPESWSAPRSKLRRPSEWVISAGRLADLAPARPEPTIRALMLLGEPLWQPPAPNGFSDDSAAWLDGLSQRVELANQFAQRAGAANPYDRAESALGPLLSGETRQTLARAESPKQAWALLLMSPELQRR